MHIDCPGGHNFVISEEGHVLSWGNNEYSQLGLSTSDEQVCFKVLSFLSILSCHYCLSLVLIVFLVLLFLLFLLLFLCSLHLLFNCLLLLPLFIL